MSNKVLVSDNLAGVGIERLRSAGVEVDNKPGLKAQELLAIIGEYDALIVRSATRVTPEVLEAGVKLKVVGRAGIGVDNIAVDAATKRGVVVMNTPGGNAVTAAEHAIALMLSVARKIPQATASLKQGKWEKKKFLGTEITGKVLGVLGLGNIGRIVADRAQGLHMSVCVFDPFLSAEAAAKLNVEKVEMEDLLRRADFITVHTPLTDETRNLIDASALEKCKDGVVIINAARGGIVNEEDLAAALNAGKVGGAGIDVFTEEPPPADHPLLSADNVVVTPHLGASTTEAQEKVALQIADQIVGYFDSGEIRYAVNFPPVGAEVLKLIRPYLVLAEKMGSLLGQLSRGAGPIKSVSIDYEGDIAANPRTPLTAAFLKGLFTPALEVSVNYVNAAVVAAERGIKVRESHTNLSEQFLSLITVDVRAGETSFLVSGTVVGRGHPRIVRFNDFYLEAIPSGHILVLRNRDVPGVVGDLGSLLGKRNINIARLQLGRRRGTSEALSFVNVDSSVSEDVMKEIAELPAIISVQQVYLE